MFAFVCRVEKIELNKRLSFLPYIALSKVPLIMRWWGFLVCFWVFRWCLLKVRVRIGSIEIRGCLKTKMKKKNWSVERFVAVMRLGKYSLDTTNILKKYRMRSLHQIIHAKGSSLLLGHCAPPSAVVVQILCPGVLAVLRAAVWDLLR